MTGRLDREEFIAGFLAEADELLRASFGNLLELEAAARSGQPQGKLVRELFRALHTLKGLAAMVEVEPVVALAHEMEAVLRGADRGARRLSVQAIDLLLQGLRAIEPRVRAVAERRPVPPAPSALVAALSSLDNADAAAGLLAPTPPTLALEPEVLAKLTTSEQEQLSAGAREGRRAVRLEFVPSPDKAARGVTITTVRERVGQIADIVRVLPRSVPRTDAAPGGLAFTLLVLTSATPHDLAAAVEAPLETVAEVSSPGAAAADAAADADEPAGDDAPMRSSYVRVDVARLDEALEHLSALVVTGFRLTRAVSGMRERGADTREVGAILQETGRQLRDLRASIMRARMVSVDELLERVPLLVRGLSQRTGKQARVEVLAGRAELDKAVAERVQPAIVHLVRNAVDHALEDSDERRRLGKPPEGLVRVTAAQHSDSQLELRVSDDGRGIDAASLARRAGAEVPADSAGLLELMCRPGLSTLDRASETSGRGMGMDIVKRTIEALGGELALDTAVGVGTTFTLRLPLSISILDAFSFECAEQPFVVPVATVEEIVALDAVTVTAAPGARALRLLERRGEVMPLLPLAEVFDLPGRRAPLKALVVRRGSEAVAFGVDRMLGQQEVVLRPLEDPLVRVPGVSATTDLGDGRPTLVLDLPALAASGGAVPGPRREAPAA